MVQLVRLDSISNSKKLNIRVILIPSSGPILQRESNELEEADDESEGEEALCCC